MTIFIFFLVFIGIAGGLSWFLLFHDHGEREPIGALWLALGFGAVGALMALFLERSLLGVSSAMPKELHKLAWATLGIGVIEEACKFLPLAFYIYKKRYFNENTDGVVYFALAGLGFGVPENILYTIQFGTGTGMTRLFLTPFFHAATTAMIGYFLAKGKVNNRSAFWVIIPLVFMMVAHALYNFGLSSDKPILIGMSVAITLMLSGGLFVLFLRANENDQDRGLSSVGHNSFCRSCGAPNPKHHLYCTDCGKNA